jgi:hypothetical protein
MIKSPATAHTPHSTKALKRTVNQLCGEQRLDRCAGASIAQGPDPPQNKRFDIKGANALANADKLHPLWVQFVKYHVSPAFFQVNPFGVGFRVEGLALNPNP